MPSAMNAAVRSSCATWTSRSSRGRQGERHRRAARAGRDHGVAQSHGDPLVDERRAERDLYVGRRHGGQRYGRILGVVLPTVSVEIWSDVVCPWCYIGKRRFETAVEQLRDEVQIEVVFRAVPARPHRVARQVDAGEGRVREEVRRPRARRRRSSTRSRQSPPTEGLDFHMERALRANTLLAHRLLWLAEATGHQYALKERLLQAYFVDGLDVGDPDVLADCAGGRRDAARRRASRSSTATTASARCSRSSRSPPRPRSPRCRRSSSTASGRSPARRTPTRSSTSSAGCSSAATPRRRDAWHRSAVATARRPARRRGGGPGRGTAAGVPPRLHADRQLVEADRRALRATRATSAVVVDLPGHGESANVRADLRRTADMIAAIGGPATYVGYSLGGRAALHVALMYPNLVQRSSLIGANPGIDDEDERARRRDSDDDLAEHLRGRRASRRSCSEWVALPLFGGLPRSARWRWPTASATPSRAWRAACAWRAPGAQGSLWPRLRELNMPVLAMAGANDAKFAAIAQQIADSVPRGECVIVPGAAHCRAPRATGGRDGRGRRVAHPPPALVGPPAGGGELDARHAIGEERHAEHEPDDAEHVPGHGHAPVAVAHPGNCRCPSSPGART